MRVSFFCSLVACACVLFCCLVACACVLFLLSCCVRVCLFSCLLRACMSFFVVRCVFVCACLFGPDRFWTRPLLTRFVFPLLARSASGPDRFSPGPVGIVGSEGWGPEGVWAVGAMQGGAEWWGGGGGKGGANTSRFFFHLPHPISLFIALSGVFSWNCGPGSRPWTSQIVRLGFSDVILCEPWRPPKSGQKRSTPEAAQAKSGPGQKRPLSLVCARVVHVWGFLPCLFSPLFFLSPVFFFSPSVFSLSPPVFFFFFLPVFLFLLTLFFSPPSSLVFFSSLSPCVSPSPVFPPPLCFPLPCVFPSHLCSPSPVFPPPVFPPPLPCVFSPPCVFSLPLPPPPSVFPPSSPLCFLPHLCFSLLLSPCFKHRLGEGEG